VYHTHAAAKVYNLSASAGKVTERLMEPEMIS